MEKPLKTKEISFCDRSANNVVNIENINLPGQLPSKLIDYAISNRPILSINTSNFKSENVIEFLNGNYQNRLAVDNLEDYRIEEVTNKFIDLINS